MLNPDIRFSHRIGMKRKKQGELDVSPLMENDFENVLNLFFVGV